MSDTDEKLRTAGSYVVEAPPPPPADEAQVAARKVVTLLGVGEMLDPALKRLEHGVERIPTGWKLLDKALADTPGRTGGFVMPSFVVLGAGPKQGKTTWASFVAEHHAHYSGVALVVDFENGPDRFMRKMLCRMSGIGPASIARGLTPDELPRWQGAIEKIRGLNLYYSNDRGLTPDLLHELVGTAKAAAGQRPVLVVIDSLQKLPMRMENRRDGIDGWLRAIEKVRDEHRVVVLAISELGRNKDARDGYRATAAGFKESGGIEYTADLTLGLNRVDDKDPDEPRVMRPLEVAAPPPPRPSTLHIFHNRDGLDGVVADYVQDFPYYGMSEQPHQPEAQGNGQPKGRGGSRDLL